MTDSTYHFVVIDDDNVNNAVCTAAIKTATNGITPVCFSNPVEAFHYIEHEYLIAHENVPTILFLDLGMPEMSGWDWLFKFEQLPHALKKQITIYILTSSISSKDAEKARYNVYVKGYILKPLQKAKVLEVLEANHFIVNSEV
ncbi:MAG TPA: response regulator [Bacteroidia bacterium]|jgi:CheY-like chemotaxis protein|nr:response regulator [Bacteroidia bacterium]